MVGTNLSGMSKDRISCLYVSPSQLRPLRDFKSACVKKPPVGDSIAFSPLPQAERRTQQSKLLWGALEFATGDGGERSAMDNGGALPIPRTVNPDEVSCMSRAAFAE